MIVESITQALRLRAQECVRQRLACQRRLTIASPVSLRFVPARTLVRTVDGLRPRCAAFPPANPCDAE